MNQTHKLLAALPLIVLTAAALVAVYHILMFW
jgi:hypothetical protein